MEAQFRVKNYGHNHIGYLRAAYNLWYRYFNQVLGHSILMQKRLNGYFLRDHYHKPDCSYGDHDLT